MTDLYKRTWFRAAALGVVAAALMVGCGKKEEPLPAPVVEAPKPEPLKIAFAYVGPVGDGGWTFAHDNARKAWSINWNMTTGPGAADSQANTTIRASSRSNPDRR